MTDPAPKVEAEQPQVPSDEEVEAAIQEFGGDAREAVRGLLQDIATLAEDRRRVASWGFLRGHLNVLKLP